MIVVPYKHLIPYACQFESYNPVNPLILQILFPLSHLPVFNPVNP